jgi:hypothetical protein
MSAHVLLWRIVGAFMLILLVSCSDNDTIKDPLVSEYELSGELFSIDTNMYWENADTSGEVDQIRLMEPIPNADLFDLIIISPVPGPDSLEGNYIFSKTGDIGTYDLVFVHAFDGEDKYQWLTNGENGEQLVIELDGVENGQNIYRLVIPNFTLNYGYWDYLAGKWILEGQKQFKISYQGPFEM